MILSLSPAKISAICTALKDPLPKIIKTATDFSLALHYLNAEQRTTVYTTLKDKLPDLIETINDLKLILLNSSDEQQKNFFQSSGMLRLLPKIMTNIDEEVPDLYQTIQSDAARHAFNRAYFSGLLLTLAQMNQNLSHDDYAHSCIQMLHTQLTKESNQYFNSPQRHHDALKNFQNHCYDHINNTKNALQTPQEVTALLGEILLAATTFGRIPMISMIKSKIEAGKYECQFFESPTEQSKKNMLASHGQTSNCQIKV